MVPNTASPTPFTPELPIDPYRALVVPVLPVAALLPWLMPTQIFATSPIPFSLSGSASQI